MDKDSLLLTTFMAVKVSSNQNISPPSPSPPAILTTAFIDSPILLPVSLFALGYSLARGTTFAFLVEVTY